MDVLKGCFATAGIYGARVPQWCHHDYQPKRGKAGEATITYDGIMGWQGTNQKLI